MSTDIYTSYDSNGAYSSGSTVWGSVDSDGALTVTNSNNIPATLVIPPTNYSGTTITKIADSQFDYNTSITSIAVNVKYIGREEFRGCTNVTTV